MASIAMSHSSTPQSTDSNSLTPIKGLQTTIKPNPGSAFLITLTAPDTWNSEAGGETWFAITAHTATKPEKQIIASGIYTCAIANQRIPMSLNVRFPAPGNEVYTILGQWRTGGKGSSHLGSSLTTMTVLTTP